MARIPERIGKYKVVSQVASGGMGAVYKAEHPTLSRYVIIKKLTLRGDSAIRERFRREAQLMMDFKSDYIVDVYDHFREGAYYHIVLEYVDGVSLDQLLRRERYLPEEIALLILRDCCLALRYAHARGVVHRDIKPGNILISNQGQIKLVDFGVASIHDDLQDSLTKEGMTLGTPAYMPPEQFHNSHAVDKRADVYAVGVMLYEMLTGKKPFPGSMTAEAIRLVQHGKYRRPRKVNPKVSRFSERLIRTCMRVKRERRFQDLEPVLRKLNKRLAYKNADAPDARLRRFIEGNWQPPEPPSQAKRALVAAAMIVLLAGGGFGAYAYYTGYYHEILYAEEYGAAALGVRIEKNGRTPEDLVIRGVVYRQEEGRNAGEQLRVERFSERERDESADFRVVHSDRFYLPAGRYRVRIEAADTVFWRSFEVKPRVEQRDSAGSADGRLVEVVLSVPPPQPLEVETRVIDGETGRRMLDGYRVEVRLDGAWRELGGGDEYELESGSRYRFRISADGYRSEEYELEIPPHQWRLRLQAELQPG